VNNLNPVYTVAENGETTATVAEFGESHCDKLSHFSTTVWTGPYSYTTSFWSG